MIFKAHEMGWMILLGVILVLGVRHQVDPRVVLAMNYTLHVIYNNQVDHPFSMIKNITAVDDSEAIVEAGKFILGCLPMYKVSLRCGDRIVANLETLSCAESAEAIRV